MPKAEGNCVFLLQRHDQIAAQIVQAKSQHGFIGDARVVAEGGERERQVESLWYIGGRVISPQAKTVFRQNVPWEVGAGVFFARRGNVGMADEVCRGNVVALFQIGEQGQ